MAKHPFTDREIAVKVRQDMLDAGWQSHDILENPSIPSQKGYSLRADFVLLAELYPLAIVEVKSSHSSDSSGALEQAEKYAEQIDLTFVLVANGNSYVSKNISTNVTKIWEQFPTQQELLILLGNNFDQNDPRLIPALTSPSHFELHHTLAIKQSLDAILEGKKNQSAVMPTGTGSTFVIAQIINKLLTSNQYQRLIYISDRVIFIDQTYHFLSEYRELEHFLSRDANFDSDKRIFLLTENLLRKVKDKVFNPENNYKQIIITHHIELSEKLRDLACKMPQIQILGFLNDFPKSKESYYESKEQDRGTDRVNTYEDVDIIVPEDHRALTIGDIAEAIDRGIMLKKHDGNLVVGNNTIIDTAQSALLLNGRSVLPSGEINYSLSDRAINIKDLDPCTLEKYLVKPGDILIPAVSKRLNAIAIVPEGIQRHLLFSSALVRIRVNPEKAVPQFVFSFLRSDTGKSLLSRNASSSLLDDVRISIQSLSTTAIFLPSLSKQHSAGNSPPNNEDKFSYLFHSIEQLEYGILPQLKDLSQTGKFTFTTQDELAAMSLKLRKIASSLAPAPLFERVMNEYPTPIALAYRCFYDSRFNVYEKTQRLRDLFETSFVFIYNLVLADWLKNLDPINYFIPDPGARRSYKTFALARKNDFLKCIIKVSKNSQESDLFLSEITTSPLTNFFDSLKDLRNHLSHSATATKSKQEKILSDNEPLILDLLESLDFLRDYRLVRVPLSYRKSGKEIYRMEVYKGVAPQLVEEPIEEDGGLEEGAELKSLKMAEHDHLVLLRKDGKILDLHPFYQLIDNEKTQYQPHIWFFKQLNGSRKQNGSAFEKQITLEGEIISNSETISLKGTEEFENLLRKILETKP